MNNFFEIENPVTKFIEWSGSKNAFFWYDKEKGEKVFFDKPLAIIMIEQYFTIKGFHEQSGSGIFSNEIHNTKTERFNVRAHGTGTIAEGYYQDISGKIKAQGGKFCNSVYAVMGTDSEKGDYEIVNIQFYGSALGPFIDAKLRRNGNFIILSPGVEPKKKGSNKYFEPLISQQPSPQMWKDIAVKEYENILEYFKQRKARKAQREQEEQQNKEAFQEFKNATSEIKEAYGSTEIPKAEHPVSPPQENHFVEGNDDYSLPF